MDISDVAGDAAAGVRTVPVLLGPRPTLAIVAALLAGCWGISLWVAVHGGSLGWELRALRAVLPSVSEGAVRAGAAALASWSVAGWAAAVWGVWRSNFSADSIARAVDVAVARMGLGLALLLAIC